MTRWKTDAHIYAGLLVPKKQKWERHLCSKEATEQDHSDSTWKSWDTGKSQRGTRLEIQVRRLASATGPAVRSLLTQRQAVAPVLNSHGS